MSMADAFSGLRLVLAAAMPWLMARGGLLPLAAWCLAAASDYVDGPIARRRGAVSLRGAVLDNVADITFVMVGLTSAVAQELIPWLVPASIGLSAGSYAAASMRSRAADSTLARSRLGHWAGVLNYACLGLVTAAVAWPGRGWSPVLGMASVVTAGINLAAVATRFAAASRWR
jgi:CDP-diacylglycerol--glycerol-3-phosphate 3-phosphatidyltransferase